MMAQSRKYSEASEKKSSTASHFDDLPIIWVMGKLRIAKIVQVINPNINYL